jgi:large subunit ribosomal protein L24
MGKTMKKLKQFDPKHHSFKSKLKKGDEVVVLTGKSRGETAKIDSIDKKRNMVYLEGANLGKRHQKPDLNNHEGGIVDIPMPLHISNVALADPKGGKATRLGYKIAGDSKTRITRKSGATV